MLAWCSWVRAKPSSFGCRPWQPLYCCSSTAAYTRCAVTNGATGRCMQAQSNGMSVCPVDTKAPCAPAGPINLRRACHQRLAKPACSYGMHVQPCMPHAWDRMLSHPRHDPPCVSALDTAAPACCALPCPPCTQHAGPPVAPVSPPNDMQDMSSLQHGSSQQDKVAVITSLARLCRQRRARQAKRWPCMATLAA
jgi:hypothetical protein